MERGLQISDGNECSNQHFSYDIPNSNKPEENVNCIKQ